MRRTVQRSITALSAEPLSALPLAVIRAATAGSGHCMTGAGKTGKTPDLTFSQDQIDAAQAYLKNTARPSAGRTLKKGDAVTTTGMAYTGLQNEFNAILDAAAEPQQSLIADSTPIPPPPLP